MFGWSRLDKSTNRDALNPCDKITILSSNSAFLGILGNESVVSFPILLNLRLLGNENGILFPIFTVFRTIYIIV